VLETQQVGELTQTQREAFARVSLAAREGVHLDRGTAATQDLEKALGAQPLLVHVADAYVDARGGQRHDHVLVVAA